MIKPVSVMNSIVKTPAVRIFATATMLTLGVLGVGACAGGSANKITEQAQTEIVSAEGAEALKAMNVETPLVSREENKKIAEKFYILAGKDVEAQKLANKALMDSWGTFAGTVQMQRVYDCQILTKLLEESLADNLLDDLQKRWGMNLHSFPSETANKFYKFDDWINEQYVPSLTEKENAAYGNIDNPHAQIVSKTIDEHIANMDFISEKEKKDYFGSVAKFRSSQTDKNSVQGYSDYIAFKTFTLDRILFKYALRTIGLTKEKGFDKAFAEFEKAAAPTP